MNVAIDNILAHTPVSDPSSATRHAGLAARLGQILSLWRDRIRDRQGYARFDERDLHDLGLSRWAVEQELAKPFWRK
jgi:uncharacterized protein YjiS (DUF1127 family)